MYTLRLRNPEGLVKAHAREGQGRGAHEVVAPETVEVGLRVLALGTQVHPGGLAYGELAPARLIYAEDRVLESRVGPWRTTDLAELEARARGGYDALVSRSRRGPFASSSTRAREPSTWRSWPSWSA
jgi:hypothetical protein